MSLEATKRQASYLTGECSGGIHHGGRALFSLGDGGRGGGPRRLGGVVCWRLRRLLSN
jgi:hypothetical protein